jgi:hypothetical protein
VVEALLGEAEAVGEVRVVVGGGLELPSQRGAELGGERRVGELGGVDLQQGRGRGVGVGLGGLTAEGGAELRGERDRRGRVGVGFGDEEAGRRRRESGGRHRRWIDRRRWLCSEGKRVFGVEGRRGVGNGQCPSTKMPLVFCFSDFLLWAVIAFTDYVNSVAQFGMGMRLALSVLLYHAHVRFID